MEDEEVVFRVLLFKLFNCVGAWEALKEPRSTFLPGGHSASLCHEFEQG